MLGTSETSFSWTEKWTQILPQRDGWVLYRVATPDLLTRRSWLILLKAASSFQGPTPFGSKQSFRCLIPPNERRPRSPSFGNWIGRKTGGLGSEKHMATVHGQLYCLSSLRPLPVDAENTLFSLVLLSYRGDKKFIGGTKSHASSLLYVW